MSKESMFCQLIENSLESICEFNDLYSNVCYRKYLPFQVLVAENRVPARSDSMQANKVASTIYKYMEENGDALEASGCPSIKVEVDGVVAVLVAPEDQSHLSRDASQILCCR